MYVKNYIKNALEIILIFLSKIDRKFAHTKMYDCDFLLDGLITYADRITIANINTITSQYNMYDMLEIIAKIHNMYHREIDYIDSDSDSDGDVGFDSNNGGGDPPIYGAVEEAVEEAAENENFGNAIQHLYGYN
jgi:hypothetical protein